LEMKWANLLSYVVLVSVVLCASVANAQFQFTRKFDKTYNVSWGLTTDKKELFLQVTVLIKIGVWVGIGWHAVNSSDDFMTQADFVIARFTNSGEVDSVKDYFSSKDNEGFDTPEEDPTRPYPGGVNNVLRYAGMQMPFGTGIATTFSFQRLLDTGDAKADHPITFGLMKVIWAHGSSNKFEFHGNSNAGQVRLNFFTGEFHPDTSSPNQFVHVPLKV